MKGTCDCPHQGDHNGDGLINDVDLNFLIDILFFNGADTQDPQCPNTRADFNCDGAPDNIDLNFHIDYQYFNGADPCDPCVSDSK